MKTKEGSPLWLESQKKIGIDMKFKSDLYYDTNITRYKNSSLSIPIFFRQLGSKAQRVFFCKKFKHNFTHKRKICHENRRKFETQDVAFYLEGGA